MLLTVHGQIARMNPLRPGIAGGRKIFRLDAQDLPAPRERFTVAVQEIPFENDAFESIGGKSKHFLALLELDVPLVCAP